MDEKQLQEIRARVEAVDINTTGIFGAAETALIRYSIDDIPDLLAEVERLREVVRLIDSAMPGECMGDSDSCNKAIDRVWGMLDRERQPNE